MKPSITFKHISKPHTSSTLYFKQYSLIDKTVLNKQFLVITCCSMKIICIQTQFCLGFNTLVDQIKVSCELSHNMQEQGW